MKAVIFDMDGLMIDTERLCVEAYDHAGDKAGIGKAGYMVYKTLGMNITATKQVYKQEFGSENIFMQLEPIAKQYFYDYYDKYGIPVKTGLINILECVKSKGYKMAVASSSSELVVRKNLTMAGVIEYFDKIVAGDMIHRSKPEPDIYLKACEVLGEAPSDCYAFEDSRNGLWSAYKAGCKTVMIPDLWQPDDETSEILYAKYKDLNEACELFK